MIIIAIIVTVIFGASTISTSYSASIEDLHSNAKQIVYIGDNGGDCNEIGNWNGVSRTCTFTKDIDKYIRIIGSDLTIDGNGHHIQLTKGNYIENLSDGSHQTQMIVIVVRNGVHDVHLKNLIVEGSSDVFKPHQHNNWGNGQGISIKSSTWNIIVENSEFYNLKVGIICDQSKQAPANQIINNKIHSNQKGILVNGKCLINENELYQNNIAIEVSSAFPVTISNNIMKNDDDAVVVTYGKVVEETVVEETVVEETVVEETVVEETVVTPTQESSEEGGGCLIATATYGSEMVLEVQQLRELRDNQLLQTESGTVFMGMFNDVYYSFSPAIADYERENPVFKEAVKLAITPMISSLSLMENATSESEVLSIGISVIMLNLGMYLAVPAIVVIGIRKIKYL